MYCEEEGRRGVDHFHGCFCERRETCQQMEKRNVTDSCGCRI